MNDQKLVNTIGIMQGRLLPPVGGRIQSFPVDTWREEFCLAHLAGLDCIEWVYDYETRAANPLETDSGIAEIRRQVRDSGVGIWSICADYYMTERLVERDGSPQESVVNHLNWLIGQVGSLGVRYMVLPFVDNSSLKSPEEIETLVEILHYAAMAAGKAGVELHLETDLEPTRLVSLLKRVAHHTVRANYDIGNSASLGYNPAQELTLLSPWLGSVHVKDRVLGGDTVPLGTGAADFPTCFRLIHAVGFRGPFILQTAREESQSEVELAIRNRKFIETHLEAARKEHSGV